MEYRAVSKNVKMSPRKVRLVADALRSMSVDNAVKKLDFINKRAARPLKKTIQSALFNAVNNQQANRQNLKFKELKVDEGITYKRYRFASRGRVAPYSRHTSHITVVLEDTVAETAKDTQKSATPATKPATKDSVKKEKSTKKTTKGTTSKKGGSK